jgi:hypothetical protein
MDIEGRRVPFAEIGFWPQKSQYNLFSYPPQNTNAEPQQRKNLKLLQFLYDCCFRTIPAGTSPAR